MADWKPTKTHKVKYFGRYKGNVKHTQVRMRFNEFKDAAFLDIRQFETFDQGDTWTHTATGLSIHIKHLRLLQKGVNEAVKLASSLGYDEDGNKENPQAKHKPKSKSKSKKEKK